MQSGTIHAALDVLPTGEFEPCGHAVHVTEPVVVLYVPAMQAVHAFPVGHVVSVMSIPFTMVFTISVVAAVFRYSSTKKRPAMS